MSIFGKSHSCCILCQESPFRVPYLKLHRFPTNEDRRNVWLNACGLRADEYLPHRLLCSRHFDDVCYTKCGYRLKSDAIPTKYLKDQIIRPYFQLSVHKTKHSTLKNDDLLRSLPSTSGTVNISSKMNESTQTYLSFPSTPKLQETPKLKTQIKMQQNKIKMLNQKVRRLKQKNLLSEEAHDIILRKISGDKEASKS